MPVDSCEDSKTEDMLERWDYFMSSRLRVAMLLRIN